MDPVTAQAFEDELSKIAGLGDLWQSFLDVFRSKDTKAKRRVEYHFSPKAGPDKWNKLIKNVRDDKFLKQLAKHPDSDEKLILHAKSMRDLSKGTPVGKIRSSRLAGQTYEIKKTPGGLACTCPDWRFKGSVNPGYQCKHIRAFKQGKTKA